MFRVDERSRTNAVPQRVVRPTAGMADDDAGLVMVVDLGQEALHQARVLCERLRLAIAADGPATGGGVAVTHVDRTLKSGHKALQLMNLRRSLNRARTRGAQNVVSEEIVVAGVACGNTKDRLIRVQYVGGDADKQAASCTEIGLVVECSQVIQVAEREVQFGKLLWKTQVSGGRNTAFVRKRGSSIRIRLPRHKGPVADLELEAGQCVTDVRKGWVERQRVAG